ncbi:MAG: hypothetical protein QOF26_4312 [Baekduia sp.]|nr:hypothetical protein [Baekduia sp.]
MRVGADRLAVRHPDRQHQHRDDPRNRQRERQARGAAEHEHGEHRLRAVGHRRERVRRENRQRDALPHPLLRDRAGPERRAEHGAQQPPAQPAGRGDGVARGRRRLELPGPVLGGADRDEPDPAPPFDRRRIAGQARVDGKRRARQRLGLVRASGVGVHARIVGRPAATGKRRSRVAERRPRSPLHQFASLSGRHDGRSPAALTLERALAGATGPSPARNMYSMLTPHVTELVRQGHAVTPPLRQREPRRSSREPMAAAAQRPELRR